MLKMSKLLPALAIVSASVFAGVNAYADHDAFFDRYLENGKMVMHAPQPTTQEEFWTTAEMFTLTDKHVQELQNKHHRELDKYFEVSSCNDDYTRCTFAYRVWDQATTSFLEQHSEEFEINYIYDPAVRSKVDEFLSGITLSADGYEVKDMELLNYWLAQATYDNTENPVGKEPMLPNFSSELATAFSHTNLDFEVDVRCGFRGTLASGQCGIGKVYFGGSYYAAVQGNVEVKANHVFYVPSDTADADLATALKNRIAGIFGEDILETVDIIRDEDGLMVADILENYEKTAYGDFIDDINTEPLYYISISNGEMGVGMPIVIKKDSSKLFTPSGLTSTDLMTGINISSDINTLPGDTKARVSALGANLEQYTTAIGREETYTYDLGLRSDSTDYDVTEEEGYTFKVVAPIPENFKGLTLSAYFVDENGEVEEYPVSADGEFEVPHFSVYTLAEASSSSDSSSDDIKAPDSGFFTKFSDGGAILIPASSAIIALTGIAIFIWHRRRA